MNSPDYDRAYYLKHQDRILARKRQWWREQGKYKKKAYAKRDRLKTYGITIADYDRMLAYQNGTCAICGAEPNGKDLHVDHCHDTGKFRGLLCLTCNAGIGLLKDSADLCYSASAYLTPPLSV